MSDLQASLDPGESVVSDIPSSAVDVVGVFDQDFNQLFNLARPLKATINRPARVMSRPVESGAVLSDFRIILPIEIELSMIVSSDEMDDTYSQIEDAFLSDALLIVQTRVGTFDNMTIDAIPHDESPDMFDHFPLALKLTEVLIVDVQYQALPPAAVEQATDASTVSRGEQTPDSGSVLFSATKAIFGN